MVIRLLIIILSIVFKVLSHFNVIDHSFSDSNIYNLLNEHEYWRILIYPFLHSQSYYYLLDLILYLSTLNSKESSITDILIDSDHYLIFHYFLTWYCYYYLLQHSESHNILPFLQETTYGFSSFILYCYCVHSINYDSAFSPFLSNCLFVAIILYLFIPVETFLYKFIALVLVLLFHIPFVTDILFPPYWVILMNICILLFLFQSYKSNFSLLPTHNAEEDTHESSLHSIRFDV